MLKQKSRHEGERRDEEEKKIVFGTFHGRKILSEKIVVEGIRYALQMAEEDHQEIGEKKDIGGFQKPLPLLLPSVVFDQIEEAGERIQKGDGKTGRRTDSDTIEDILSLFRPKEKSFSHQGADEDGRAFSAKRDADQETDEAAEEDGEDAFYAGDFSFLFDQADHAGDVPLVEGREKEEVF